MSSRRSSASTKTKSRIDDSAQQSVDVYASFSRWKSETSPRWHDVKKMRYVFWRMQTGITITDALREIHWEARIFWHIVEQNFADEYASAKVLQSRALADSLIVIAEGRDATTQLARKRFQSVITRVVKKMARTKTTIGRKMLLSQLLGDLREHDKIVMTRNKMQIDVAKWMAGKTNPSEFGERSTIGLGGYDPTNGSAKGNVGFTVTFVAPDGKEVPFVPTGDDE